VCDRSALVREAERDAGKMRAGRRHINPHQPDAGNEGGRHMAEILTPDSPRWDEFSDALDAIGRCDGDGTGESNPALVHRYAKVVMTTMGNIDIAGSIAFFEEHGGYCDCEILLNVPYVRRPPVSDRARTTKVAGTL